MTALEQMTSELASTREMVESVYALAYQLFTSNRYQNAADVFRTLVLINPREERFWLGLGQCHEELHEDQKALEMYGFGIVTAPSSIRCHLAAARVLHRQSRYDDADRCLDKAETMAESTDDETAIALVRRERANLS